jgi:hypothetical protein
VCPGSYTGSATITTGMTVQPTITTGVYVNKSINLTGLPGAIVNAATLDNGVSVFGINSARVKGFTIEGALGEGVLVADSTRITVSDNVVRNNDTGLATTSYFECQTVSKVLGNCGYGLHLLSVTHSNVLDNTAEFNSGGILITDQFGPTHGNNIKGNLVEDNSARSGIRLASDSATALSATGYRTPKLGGVYSNSVSNNIVISNGTAGFTTSTGTTGYGSGVAITADVKGGASYSNLVASNEIVGNGLSGITIYKHYALSDVSGDLIVNNWIGTNHVAAGLTAGVFIGRTSSSFPPISVTVYSNTIAFDHFGVYDNAGPGLTHFGNHFVKVVVDFKF